MIWIWAYLILGWVAAVAGIVAVRLKMGFFDPMSVFLILLVAFIGPVAVVGAPLIAVLAAACYVIFMLPAKAVVRGIKRMGGE